jgi:hypothetical protein
MQGNARFNFAVVIAARDFATLVARAIERSA